MPLPDVKVELFPEIAKRLGITVSHVRDLASYEDEVASTLSIRQVQELAKLTGLGFGDLIGFEDDDSPDPVTAAEFCTAIRKHIAERETGVSEYEEAVGWLVVGEALENPQRLYDLANWDCLRDLAESVGIDPVAVLPWENSRQATGAGKVEGEIQTFGGRSDSREFTGRGRIRK